LTLVCATTIKNKKVLLVMHAGIQKPDYGDWLLPAGKVEPKEDLEKALKREMKEETSLNIKIVKKLTEHIDPYTGDKIINFLCAPSTSKIKTSSELMRAKWFNLREIQRLENIHSGLKQFLIDGLKSGSFGE
jgi:ADP-ribose pyrophosphatase YjhB (NUDIX family)